MSEKFSGYGRPGYTTIPDFFLDQQMQDLGEAEIKVMLYIFRRTYGWKKEQDAISYSQFLQGIITRDGRQLDRGAGISRSSLWRALKSVTSKGYIFVHNETAGRTGETQETTIYELNIDGKPHWQPAANKEGFQFDTERGFNLKQARGSNLKPTINNINQKTDIQQTPDVAVVITAQIQSALEDAGINRVTASKLATIAAENGRNAQYIQNWQTYLQSQKSFTNPLGFLNRAIRENADPPVVPTPKRFLLEKKKPRYFYCEKCDAYCTSEICNSCGGPAPEYYTEQGETNEQS